MRPRKDPRMVTLAQPCGELWGQSGLPLRVAGVFVPRYLSVTGKGRPSEDTDPRDSAPQCTGKGTTSSLRDPGAGS